MTNIHLQPDLMTRLNAMGDAAAFEPAGDSPQCEAKPSAALTRTKRGDTPRLSDQHDERRYQSRSLSECITHVSTPTGQKPMLKSMLTTACERNCHYCPFRAGRGKTKRLTITPDEMAKALDGLSKAGRVQGMFLSSGIIKGSVTTQDKIIATAEIARRKYRYRGYLHLKIMPGAQYDQLYRAMQLADRISVNLEAPTSARLGALAPKKQFERELLDMIALAHRIRREHPHERLANTVTQFVVGAVGDTDVELLSLSGKLYRQMGLTRAYYSAFHPIDSTPFENLPYTEPMREHRLYQSSFLLRDYGFEVEELPFEADGNLNIRVDPKRAWADIHLRQQPIDLMTAERGQLLRVPGIGPRGADAIVRARSHGRLTDLAQLRKIGIAAPEQAAPYVLLDGRQPPVQLGLF